MPTSRVDRDAGSPPSWACLASRAVRATACISSTCRAATTLDVSGCTMSSAMVSVFRKHDERDAPESTVRGTMG
jgi:hypothetical protein